MAASCLDCLLLVAPSRSVTWKVNIPWTFSDSSSRILIRFSIWSSSKPTIGAPDFNWFLTLSGACVIRITWAGKELNARGWASQYSLTYWSKCLNTLYSRSILRQIIGQGVGSGVLAPSPLIYCLARNPNGRPGERGTWSAHCNQTNMVWVDSTLRSVDWANSSPSSCSYSIASGPWGLEVIALDFLPLGTLSFVFSPH